VGWREKLDQLKDVEAYADSCERKAIEALRKLSSTEGEVAGLKHRLQLAEAEMERLKSIAIAAVVPLSGPLPKGPPPPPSPPKQCVICAKPCISMCPACRASLCDRGVCLASHGCSEMGSV
jgi:hypothetical protein